MPWMMKEGKAMADSDMGLRLAVRAVPRVILAALLLWFAVEMVGVIRGCVAPRQVVSALTAPASIVPASANPPIVALDIRSMAGEALVTCARYDGASGATSGCQLVHGATLDQAISALSEIISEQAEDLSAPKPNCFLESRMRAVALKGRL
jgi:hypothetical protein